MKYLIFSSLIISLFIFNNSSADENLSPSLNDALKNYQNKDFEAARVSLESQLQNQSDDSVLLYNLGLVQYKLGKPGSALAYWRKALAINPRFSQSRDAINFALSQMPQKPLTAQESSTWSWISSQASERLSFHLIFPIFLIVFILSSLKLAHYFGLRKRALLNDEPLPSLSVSSLFILTLTVISLLLSAILFHDQNLKKATIVATTKGSVRVGPSDQDSLIYEIPEGTQVIIRDTSEGWYKIEDPTGRTGWININEIFLTSKSTT